MLARTVRLNSESLQDVTKQLFIWALKESRKFSTSTFKFEVFSKFDSGEGNFEDKSRNTFGDNDRFRNRFDDNDRFRNRFDNQFRERNRFGSLNNDGYRSRYINEYGNRDRTPFRRKKFSETLELVESLKWDDIELKPFKKDFYNPHPNVLNRTREETLNFCNQHDIKVFGKNSPTPIFNFEELGLSEKLNSYLRDLNFSEPTPIQALTWPVALSGRDLVGISRTGSGKTLGYVLPAMIHIQNQPPLDQNDGPVVLILAPTRELVQQIQGVVLPLARLNGFYTASLFGGVSKFSQMELIRNSREIFVATPGRLLDFLKDGVTNLKRCTYLVLDEADQMLNMGFEVQIRSIINQIRPDRQVLMWSATWPKEIRHLANDFLKDYIKIQVGSAELTANPNITQVIHVCRENEKMDILLQILKNIVEEPDHKTLIFVQTKYLVEKVGRFLMAKGFPAKTLHGNHSQKLRDSVMNSFRSSRSRLLVATNVAGRGLDVTDIKYVINYDFPQTIEEYVHKIGRTARSNNSGTAHTFFTPDNASLAQDLIELLESTNQIVTPELKEMVAGRFISRGKAGFKSV